jgi:hypothetical protein
MIGVELKFNKSCAFAQLQKVDSTRVNPANARE